MAGQSSRRDFLGLSALGLAAAMARKNAVGQVASLGGPLNETPKVGAEISIWVTSAKNALPPPLRTSGARPRKPLEPIRSG